MFGRRVILLSLFVGAAAYTPLPEEGLIPEDGPLATSDPWPIYFLNNSIGLKANAVCLDGSPGAFYVRRNASSTQWRIFFEGGGWCYDAADCANRATGNLGSSNGYPPSISNGGSGMMSTDAGMNPTFYGANTVYMKYCDGDSFAGARDGPLDVPGGDVSPIYFRGQVWFGRCSNLSVSGYRPTHVLRRSCSSAPSALEASRGAGVGGGGGANSPRGGHGRSAGEGERRGGVARITARLVRRDSGGGLLTPPPPPPPPCARAVWSAPCLAGGAGARTQAIVEATLATLVAEFGLANATELVLTGCSAGGQ